MCMIFAGLSFSFSASLGMAIIEDSKVGFVGIVQVDARVAVKIVYGFPLSELALALGPLVTFEA